MSTARRRTARDRLTVAGFRLGWALVPRLPARLAYALFDLLARYVHRAGGGGVAQLRHNYARLRPDLTGAALDQEVGDGVRSYLRYWCDLFRLPAMTPADIRRSVRAVNRHHFDHAVDEAREAGRGVTFFLGHMGNWDMAGAWAHMQGLPIVTVAERLEPEEVFQEFVATRTRLGMRIHPLTGGEEVLPTLVREMGQTVGVPLLADRDLTGGGIQVDFPGGPVSMAVGPAALALRTGATLIPVTMHDEAVPQRVVSGGRRSVLTFHPPVIVPPGRTRDKVRGMTQQCADAVAAEITAHTADWHMMQPFWADDVAAARGR